MFDCWCFPYWRECLFFLLNSICIIFVGKWRLPLFVVQVLQRPDKHMFLISLVFRQLWRNPSSFAFVILTLIARWTPYVRCCNSYIYWYLLTKLANDDFHILLPSWCCQVPFPCTPLFLHFSLDLHLSHSFLVRNLFKFCIDSKNDASQESTWCPKTLRANMLNMSKQSSCMFVDIIN